MVLNQKGLSEEDKDYLNGKSQIVGQYPPNPWGFYDMFGNVEEMVSKDPNRSYGMRSRSFTKTIGAVRSDWQKPDLVDFFGSRGFRLVFEKLD